MLKSINNKFIKAKKLIFRLILGISLIWPSFSQAAEQQRATFKNPLKTSDIFELGGSLISNVLLGVVGSIGLTMIVVGGIIWLTSGGNPERIKKAEQLILWAILGLVVIFASYIIIDTIIKAIIPTA